MDRDKDKDENPRMIEVIVGSTSEAQEKQTTGTRRSESVRRGNLFIAMHEASKGFAYIFPNSLV